MERETKRPLRTQCNDDISRHDNMSLGFVFVVVAIIVFVVEKVTR